MDLTSFCAGKFSNIISDRYFDVLGLLTLSTAASKSSDRMSDTNRLLSAFFPELFATIPVNASSNGVDFGIYLHPEDTKL